MGTQRAQASKSLFWSVVDTFSQTGFSIVALVALARFLSVPAIGEGSLVVMMAQLIVMPFEFLFHDALIQRDKLRAQDYATAFWTTLAGSFLVAGLLLLSAPWLAQLYDKPSIAPLLRVCALAIPFAAVSSVISAVLRRNLSFSMLARRTVIGRLLGVCIGVGVASAGGGAWALVLIYVASTFFSAAVLLFDRRNLPGWQYSIASLRELLRFALPNTLAQMLSVANGRIFVVLSGFFLSDVALGSFSLAFRIVEELRNTLSSAASQLALPLLVRRVHDRVQFAGVLSEATSFTSAVLLPLYAGLTAVAPDLVPLVFGEKWRDAAAVVQILAIGAMLVTLRQYSQIALNALGRPALNAKINLAAFVFSMTLLATGMVVTAEIAAGVWMLRGGILLLFSIVSLHLSKILSAPTQLKPNLPPLLGSLMEYAGMALLLASVLQHASSSSRLAAAIVSGAAIYIATLSLVSPGLVKRMGDFAVAAIARRVQA